MTLLSSLTSPEAIVFTVDDGQARAAMDGLGRAAQVMGAAMVEADQRITRMGGAFGELERRIDPVARAKAAVERETRGLVRAAQEAEQAAQREGIAQDRLAAYLATNARAREDAARRALEAARGLTEEQRAAAAAAAGYEGLAQAMRASAEASRAQSSAAAQAAAALEQQAARAAAARREMQAAVATMGAGPGVMAPQFAQAQLAAAMLEQAAAAEQLRARYVPLVAEQQRYLAQMREVREGERMGALSALEAARAREQLKASFADQVLRMQGATAAADAHAIAATAATTSTGRLGVVMGQAGFQVQDFVTQVQMGQSAMMAFGVQGAQLLGILGTGGAIAGAVLVMGTLAAQFLLGRDAAERLNEALRGQEERLGSVTQAAQRWREGLDAEARQIQELAAYYGSLDQARAAFEQRRLQSEARRIQEDRDALAAQLDGQLQRLRDGASMRGFEDARRAAQRAGLPEPRANGGVAELREILSTLDALPRAEDFFLRLAERLADLELRFPAVATQVKAVREEVDRLSPAFLRSNDALARNAAEQEALARAAGAAGPAMQLAAGTATRTAGSFAELAVRAAEARAAMARLGGYQLTGMEGAQQALEKANAELRALQRNGLAGGEAFTQEEAALRRIAEAREADINGIMQRQRVSREQAVAAADDIAAAEARSETVRKAIEAEAAAEALRKRLEEGRRATSRAGRAAEREESAERQREMQDEARLYETLRRDAATGLLSGSQADDLAIRTIQAQFREINQQRDRARQQAQRDLERQQQQADQFVAGYSRDIARGMVDAFAEAGRQGESILTRMWRSVAAAGRNLLTAALDGIVIRPIFQAVANGLGFGSPAGLLPSGLPSIFGGGGASSVQQAAAGPGALGQGGLLSSASSMYRSVTGGVASSPWFNAAVPFSETGLMGATGIGSFLNTPLYGVTGGMQAAATNSALGAIPMGPATADAVVAAGGTAGQAGGLTIGSALGPAATIAGGAYGIYSGIQKGGVGGLVGGLGGAASMVGGAGMLAGAMGVLPGLAALGPAGLIAGAVLAIAGSLLPGQKASSAAQGAGIAFEDGATWYDGNTKHFSQENRDEAERFARSIASLESTIQGKVGYGIGGYVSVGVDSARRGDPANIFLRMGGNYAEFARDEAGAKAMAEKAAEWMWAEFRSQADRAPTADVGSIIRASGTAQDFEANLQWYEQTYKVLTQNTEATSAYATSLANLRKPYDEAISKADQLGLATDALVRKRDEELARATRARDLQLQQIDFDLANRAAGSAGLVAASQAALAAEREVEQLRETLRNLGLSAAETATRLDQLAQAQARQQQTLVTAMRAEGRLDVSSTFTGVIQPLQQLLQFWQQSGGLSDRGVAPEEAWPWMFNQLKSMLGGLSYDQLKSVEVAFPQVPGADDDAVRQVVAELKRQIVQQNDRAFLDATGRGPINQIRDLIAQFEQLAPRLAEMGQNAAAWQTLEAQLGALMRDMSAEQVAAIKAAFPQGTFQPHIPGTDRQEDDLIRRIAAAREAELAAAEASAKAAEASAKAAQDLEQALQAGGSIRAFLDGLRSTGAGGLSPGEQLLNAQQAFGRDLTLSRAGDADALARITGTAQNLLAAGQGMYASSPDFAALRAFVMSSLESLPATRTYDAQILKALQDLGGSVNVAVEVQSVRQISEVLNALSTEDKARLVQTATVVRTVEERLGRALTATEREGLIQAADVLRTVQQNMGADLTAAQRAGLVQGGAVIRSIEQGLSRSLTAGERAALIEGGAIGSYVFQFLQRDLTESERAALVAGGTALRQVEQSIGRNLTDAERDSLIQSGYALHAVFQMMGGNLSAAERDSLVQSALVVRSIEQSLARSLTDAERASLVDGGAIGSFVYQFLQRDLTAAERAALVQAGIVSRDVRQAIETTETVQISRSVDDKLSGILQAINRSMLSLIVVSQAGFASVARTVASGTYTSPGVALDQSGRLGEYQDDSGFVASLYRSLLRREPDPQGMSAILAFLGRGGSRGEVLDGFTFAPEFWRVGYASGGLVTGGIPGVDSVPANLMPGEYVLRAEAVRGLGAANLDVLNAGYIPAVPVANDGGSTEEVRELRRAVQGLREEVAALRAERARDAQQVKASLSRTADAAEDTAASNRVIARDSRGVVGDRRRAG